MNRADLKTKIPELFESGVVVINKIHSILIALVLLIGIVAAVVIWKGTVEAGIDNTQLKVDNLQIETQEQVEELKKKVAVMEANNAINNRKMDEVIFNLKNFMETKGVKYQSMDR